MKRKTLLAISLAANAVLGLAYWRSAEPSAGPAGGRAVRAAAEGSTTDAPGSASTLAPSQPSGAPATIDELRALGFPPNALRSLQRARVNEKYQDRIRTLVGAPDELPSYWKLTAKYDAYIMEPARRMEIIRLRQELDRDYRDPLGADAVAPVTPEERDAYVRKYGDLAPETAARVESIEAENTFRQQVIHGPANGYYSTLMPQVGEETEAAQATREYEAALAAVLSPAQLDEYRLRVGRIPKDLREQLALFDPSEAEFRAIARANLEFDQKYGSRDFYTGMTAAQSRERQSHEPELAASIEGLLAQERAAEFRSSRVVGPALPRFLARLELPVSLGRELMAIRREIQDKTSRLRTNRELASAERNAQLQEISDEANARVSAKISGRALEMYRLSLGSWLRNIAPPPATRP